MYPMALYVIIQNIVVAAGMVVARLFFPHVLSEATTSVSARSDLYVTFLTVSAVISTVLFGIKKIFGNGHGGWLRIWMAGNAGWQDGMLVWLQQPALLFLLQVITLSISVLCRNCRTAMRRPVPCLCREASCCSFSERSSLWETPGVYETEMGHFSRGCPVRCFSRKSGAGNLCSMLWMVPVLADGDLSFLESNSALSYGI